MLRNALALAGLGAALAVPPAALAQDPAPDVTRPSAALRIDTTLNSIDAMIGSGLTFSVDPSEDVTWTAKATIEVKGRTVVVAKSIDARSFSNQSGGYIAASIPDAGAKAEKALRRIRRGKKAAVTLTVVLEDAAGNTGTVKKAVRLRRRY